MNEVLIIMPAYNEERNIKTVLKNIKDLDMPLDILVVNDGSMDNTVKEALEEGVKIISHPYNLGCGAALQTGFKYASLNGYKYIISFDSDGQHSAGDISAIYNELKKGDYDIVIGSRFLKDPRYNIGFMKKITIVFFRFLIKSLTGKRITDPTSGLRGFNSKAFNYFSICDNFPSDYPDADVLIKMLYLKFRIYEVPAQMRERVFGKSMHSGLKPILYIFKMLISIFIVALRGSSFSREVSQ